MDLPQIAKALVASGKGILASDESFPTIEKRFKTINLESTEDSRKAYRDMLFATAGIEDYLSGIILFDETLRQKLLTNSQVIAGIKVDQGLQDYKLHPPQKITKGIEGLSERLKEYKNLGALFTKWRAVFTIATELPTIQFVEESAKLLAEFAKISQTEELVPIVEPEVLMDGTHDIDKCYEATRAVLKVVFIKLIDKVNLRGMLLKSNMVLPGKESGQKVTPEDIAQKTLEVLEATVPPEVPGIVFLSGGQTPDEATVNLNAINKSAKNGKYPWQLSFSFGRALQDEALKAWNGKAENIKLAQDLFLERLKMVSAARKGEYTYG